MSTPSASGVVVPEKTSLVGVLAGLVAVSAWGVSGVVAKHLDMGGLAIAAYRFLIYAVVVGSVLGVQRKGLSLRVMRATFVGGVALAADVALFFSAVKLTAVANATVIGALQPVVVGVVAWIWLGERVPRRDMFLGLMAFAGVVGVVILGGGQGEASLSGDLLAVGALVAWSTYFVVAKRSMANVSSTEFTVGVALWVGLWNIPLAVMFGQSLAWPTLENWLWLFGLALGAGIAGHAAMNWALERVPLWLGSSLTLLVPVVSTAAAWAFLGETINGWQVLCMLVVLGALAVVVVRQTT